MTNRHISVKSRLTAAGSVATLVSLGFMATSCTSETGAPTNRQAASVATLEADLAPRLEDEFGPATLHCGAGNFFSGGVAVGEQQAGNSLNCVYVTASVKPDDNKEPVIVDVVVVVPEAGRYSYAARSVGAPHTKKEAQPTPEWMYRDGLTCEQPAAPLSKDTIMPGLSPTDLPESFKNDEFSYENAVFSAYFNASVGELTTDSSGWPCTDTYPMDEVKATQQSVRSAG